MRKNAFFFYFVQQTHDVPRDWGGANNILWVVYKKNERGGEANNEKKKL